jgi:hypothetical protein
MTVPSRKIPRQRRIEMRRATEVTQGFPIISVKKLGASRQPFWSKIEQIFFCVHQFAAFSFIKVHYI